MPVYLPPISRREFLKRSLLAGTGWAMAPSLVAASRATAANSWALLADTHIAGDPAKIVRGINMADHFKRVSQELLALPGRPAGALIIGDCAFLSGEKDDYTTLTGLLDPLRAGGLPLHLALGNHDERDNFRAALETKEAAKHPVADKQVALLRTSAVNWFVLDSLEKTAQTPGSLGQAQLDWLAKSLDANWKKPAIILIHHHPVKAETGNGLKDTQRLLELIRPRKQVKAWIFGHTHLWNVSEDESGIHFVNLPPVAYVFQAGRPAGWVHAMAREDGMRLELRCIDSAHKDHGQVVNLKWRTA
jgi:3',5'-cyclic AMP phosphodiesterase CpdA